MLIVIPPDFLIFPEIEEDFKDDATMVSVMLREEDIERRSQKTRN